MEKKLLNKGILLVRRAYGYGGAEIYNVNLTRELKNHGYTVTLVTQQADLAREAAKKGASISNPLWLGNIGGPEKFGKRVLLQYLLASPWIIGQYLNLIRKHHIVTLNLQTRDDQVFGTIAAKILRKRVIWTDHGDLKLVLKVQDNWFRRIFFFAMSLADAVVCVADAEKRLIEPMTPPNLKSKYCVIHNGVSSEQFFMEPKLTDKDFTVGSTARIQWQKGVDYLIEGFAQALPNLPKSSQLLLSNVVDDQYIMDKIEEFGITDHVQHVGYIANADLPKFLMKLDVYVFPSLTEAFPLSVLEAMMAGRAVVATNVGGIPEQIHNGINGLVVPPKSSKAIAQALIALESDQEQRLRLAHQASKDARASFDFSKIVKEQIVPLLEGSK